MPRNYAPWLDETPDMPRYPRIEGIRDADVAVVGAGIVGTLAAWHCARRGLRTVLIEKNRVVTGDTGATTGFLTKVPDTSIAALAGKHGPEFASGVFAATAGAQRELVALIEEQGIECGLARCSAYWCAYEPGDAALDAEGEALKAAYPGASFVRGEDVAGAPFAEAVRIPDEAKYDPRRFLVGLLSKAPPSLEIFEGSEATDVDLSGDGVIVRTDAGAVRAKRLIVATGRPFDAFSELHPLLEPKLTYVVAAKYRGPVLSDDVYWDTLDPYFYYRTVDRDTVIVGGCDVAHADAGSGEPFKALAEFLRRRIPGDFEVVREWSGSIFHTADGLPYAFAHPHAGGKVFIGTGFGGNGMVFGALVARTLAASAAGEEDPAARFLSLARTGATVARPEHKREETIAGFVPVAPAAEFDAKPMRCAMIAGRKVAVFKTGDGFHAIDNTCSHQGGSLCDGELEGAVVRCPLHGARFDVRTGRVVGPPAVRSQRPYAVRVRDGMVEVGPPGEAAPAAPATNGAEARERTWGSFFRFAGFACLFWLAQFLYQYLGPTKGEIGGSLVRSFALSGATFIGTALSLSAVFKWRPALAVHWRTRRRFGVAGFSFIALHAFSVLKFFFNFDPSGIFWSLNPLENPIIFGEIAFFLFFLMAATSFDLAVEKLGRNWKRLHRVAYFAWWAAVFHFITINPELLKNPPGYLLLAVTAFALFGQLYWYVRIAGRRRFLTVGGAVGAIVILLYAVTGHLVYRRHAPAAAPPSATASSDSDLGASVEAMKRFMAENPADPDVAAEPLDEFRSTGGDVVRSGAFRNVNYMTSGSASLRNVDGRAVVVFEDDFETPNGPDLRVYLTPNAGPTERADIREGVLLGKLKSIRGMQAYDVPEGTRLDDYRSVSIHCQAFNVPWSYAPLE
jgi:glycine/D-amino acid oxidase-like deaminating enzyme/nitrite reductase/ring-hydroxylating ferredoxin subunit/DMSO/TMAO reductase YedYZ heme-binding membrane subunit